MTDQYVVELGDLDRSQVAAVGSKAAHLGELSRVAGVRVPPGFCVTTHAFREALSRVPSIDDLLDRLTRLGLDDTREIRSLGEEIRRAIESASVPADVQGAVARALAGLGDGVAYAVRSSATAEDLTTASFAGQHDSYLNVIGTASVLADLSRCWASLFSERAVTYRARNGIDHRSAHMAVVVQQMVVPDAAGVLFTADPVSGNRMVSTVEAGFGLGEALVSGLSTPDVFTVRGEEIVDWTISSKRHEVRARPGGGTEVVRVEATREREPALSPEQLTRLVRLGRSIEAHAGRPQDIEWALSEGDFHVVQTRPITTLFPVPTSGDDENHVYVSVGHQQMMTDAMRPLGLSMWQLTAMVPMHEAGGRLFVDVTARLSRPTSRASLLEVMGRGDPLTRSALETLLDRGDFVPSLPDVAADGPASGPSAPLDTDPGIVTGLIERSRASIAALREGIRDKTGPELFDYLLAAFVEHTSVLADPVSIRAIMAGMESTWWLNDRLHEWLGETNAADTLTLSAPRNVTSEMGLALLDVADVVRARPEVVALLESADESFLDTLPSVPGGAEARQAIEAYLERYGMRCVGEIDITRPRWSEKPTTLVPVILDNVRNFAPGAAGRRFEEGLGRARRKADEVLARLRALPEGEVKAAEVEQMIARVRTFIGYREYPKYDIVSRYFVYKQALLREVDRLVGAGVLSEVEDAFFLTFDELHEITASHHADRRLIRQRREDFAAYQALRPPRVLTSDGEGVAGSYQRVVPTGALVGLPVSSGTVEGRARVIRDMADADLAAGDILVTPFTDPSWSPLFVAIAGLVTEVGGLMTHGAVIAREYGLPAVVGVEGATRLIPDGQRIRVNGAEGYVELLS